MEKIYQPSFLGINLFDGEQNYKPGHEVLTSSSVTSKKSQKGATILTTLELHKSGKSILEIAKIRSLAVSTIEGHLNKLIGKEELTLEEVLTQSEIEQISYQILRDPKASITEIKKQVAPEFSFNKIRMVKSYLDKLEKRMNQ
jgi:uncharacterized protein YpbB